MSTCGKKEEVPVMLRGISMDESPQLHSLALLPATFLQAAHQLSALILDRRKF